MAGQGQNQGNFQGCLRVAGGHPPPGSSRVPRTAGAQFARLGRSTALTAAEAFYRDVLGLAVRRTATGLELDVTGGAPVFVYPQGAAHEPTAHTVLTLVVPDVPAAAADLHRHHVELVRYPGFAQDADGVVRAGDPRQGPTIGWFRDPAGNVMALVAG